MYVRIPLKTTTQFLRIIIQEGATEGSIIASLYSREWDQTSALVSCEAMTSTSTARAVREED